MLECGPVGCVDGRVWIMKPDAEDIVDVPLVDEEVLAMARHDAAFMYGKEEVGILAGWRGPHCSAGELVPVSIPELKDIIFHYN